MNSYFNLLLPQILWFSIIGAYECAEYLVNNITCCFEVQDVSKNIGHKNQFSTWSGMTHSLPQANREIEGLDLTFASGILSMVVI